MSFTAPDHPRALFYSLFATSLYTTSAVWFGVITRRPIDPVVLTETALGTTFLVYGVIAIHRLFWVNAVPLLHGGYGSFLTDGSGTSWVAFVIPVAIIGVSSILFGWALYHSVRIRFRLAPLLKVPVILAAPLILHELLRHAAGIDIFHAVVGFMLLGL